MQNHFTTSPLQIYKFFKSVTFFQPQENCDNYKYTLFKLNKIFATVSTFYENLYASNNLPESWFIVTSRHFF